MAKSEGDSGNGWMAAAGMGIASGISGIWNGMSMKRKYKYAKKMADYEQNLQKDLNVFNQGLALDTWEKTGYDAQVQQLKKAGLNPGLMYGQAGAGGTTQSGAGTSAGQMDLPDMTTEGMAVQSAVQTTLQAKMQQAQIENINANTEKTKVDTQKTAGVDTEKATAEIAAIAQGINNAELQNDIMNLDKQVKNIELNIANETQESAITKINAEMWKAIGEAESAETKGKIDKATKEEIIAQIEQTTVEQQIRISAMKANIQLTNAEIKETYNAIENLKQNTEINWGKLSVDEKEMKIKEELMKFQTSDAARLQQWTNAIKPVVDQALEKRAPLKPQNRRVEKGQRGRWGLGQ